MTSDRPEHTHDDAEHGVLSDTGSLDTTGIGILGGNTAQVNVSLPAPQDDDDDYLEDEAPAAPSAFDSLLSGQPMVIEVPADEVPETAAADQDAVVDEEAAFETETEAVVEAEPIAQNTPQDEPVADVAHSDEAYHDEDIVTVPEVVSDPVNENEFDETPAPAAPASAAKPQPGPQPLRDVSPVTLAPAEMTLTSKRLGEFEADRETADLLTADRLLDPNHVVKSEPEGAWQHLVYSLSGRRINLGDSKRARERKALDRRIAAPLTGGASFVPVLSRKGGVGKTTVTTLLGMALADARDDRVIAVDANPDRGTLAERISRTGGKTVRDLVRLRGDVVGFNDLSGMVARDETRLDVVASDADPRVSEAFSDVDYRDVASLAAHYYSIVLTDTGTGIVHSVMSATLQTADQLVIVAGLSVDEARLASETLTWLETNGYAAQVRNAVVVINSARPGSPVVRLDELDAHFKTRVRAVQRMPYDPHIAAGSAISFRDLAPETRLAARELAATVVEGLRSLASAA